MANNALKKALTHFVRKGDSFKVSNEMKQEVKAKAKQIAQKVRLAVRKTAAKEKKAAK